MDHYIRLLTSRELSDNEMEQWYNTVEDFAPDGVVIDWDTDENQECTDLDDEDCGDEDFYYVHLIELSRHLTRDEAEFVISVWESRFADDFKIEISHLYNPAQDIDPQQPFDIEIDTDLRSQILDAASKFIHNRWIDAKTIEGWRYGLDHSIKERTSPMMKNWDDLPESYRRVPQLTERELLDFFVKNKHVFK